MKNPIIVQNEYHKQREETMSVDFVEFASLHCYNKFIDGKWLWAYKEKYKRTEIGWLNTEQLYKHYLKNIYDNL